MEKKGNFLETGSYNGHYYGTPKPLLRDFTTDDPHDSKEISTAENENNETDAQGTDNNTEHVIVHRENEDLNDTQLENGLENGSENNTKRDEIEQNQPIDV